MKPIIEVRNLSKQYKIGQKQRYLSLRDSVSDFFKSKGRNTEGSDFWALDDVSFDVHAGESIGIIGRNGAGKSTLLKILSRITPPTKGKVILRGRLASLLEVGTGFHSELTGRENVFMNGSMLGLRRAEILSKFDEIVDFSGVEQFIDTPLKHYSSGMQLRLAFAVAAHLEPEILAIDEVLAVGDAAFQKKCLGKMDEVSKAGRTILFVSHNIDTLIKFCSKGIILNKGKIVMQNTMSACLESYSTMEEKLNIHKWKQTNITNNLPFFEEANLKISGTQPHLKLDVSFSVNAHTSFPSAFVAININNSMDNSIMQALPKINPFIHFDGIKRTYNMQIHLEGLIPGVYSLSLWLGSHNNMTYDWQKNILRFDVLESPTIDRIFPHSFEHGHIVPSSNISIVQ